MVIVGRRFDCVSGDIIVSGRHHFSLYMVEVLCRILNHCWLAARILKWVPDYVQPIAISELSSLVPLVRREANGLPSTATLDFDPSDPSDWVTVAGLWVGWADAADVKSNFLMSDTFTLEAPRCFIGDHDVFSSDLALATDLGIQVIEGRADLFRD